MYLYVLIISGLLQLNILNEMSIVTLQLGQCGNQIGFEFFDLLSRTLVNPDSTPSSTRQCDELAQAVSDRFFSVSKENVSFARAVMVDMEQKVIAQALQDARRSSLWRYQKDQNVAGKKGSGNNWAQGYCCHGPQSITDILEKVSTEVEKCDSLGGFLALMSLAGGTGSGLGAFVTTALRDEYPHSSIVNEVIWPYATGEVIVQNYNAVLTLSHLYSSSDGIIIMENDQMQKICSQLLKIKNVSFKDINKVVATKLAGILLPTQISTTGHSKFLLADILANVCSHPGYKLLNILNIPIIPKTSLVYTSYNWKMLVKHCRQMLIANANMEEGINWAINPTSEGQKQIPAYRPNINLPATNFNKSLSNQLFLRGKDSDQVDVSSFQDPLLYAPWVPPIGRAHVAWNSIGLNDLEKSVTLLSNSQIPLRPLNSVVDKAWEMFASRAYVHQYNKYGITEDDFVDSFVYLEQVIKNYASI